MPGLERRAAHVPGAAELVADYEAWLAVDGHGSRSYRDAAWSFLAHWPDPAGFGEEPLEVQASLGVAQRPFVTYLMVTGRLRPGYDYLARKIGGLLTQARRRGPLAADIAVFTAAATELDYSAHTIRCCSERVIVRLLIQTGHRLTELSTDDLDTLAAALHRRAQANGKPTAWVSDRAMISTAHRVLFHLGILDSPPTDPRRRPGLRGHYSGVPEPLRTLLLDYCDQAATTRAPATIKAIAGHLANFGRFLASCDPPVTDLAMLDRAAVEGWLASLAAARRRDGAPMSVGSRRGRIIAVRQFLTDITEWGWPAAPARTLIFSRDLPRLTHPLPRYLPPDADRALQTALQQMSASGPAVTRLHADALLLTRATGLRIGELGDLELDCVHQIDGHGAWLKVPLGKLASERMVPLDEETLAVIDRIVARRTPGRPLPHPRTGRPVDFLLVHQGRRVSACALREELARAAQHRRARQGHPPRAETLIRNSPGQRRMLTTGADATPRARIGGDEPALRAAVRRHRARGVRTGPHPDQGTPGWHTDADRGAPGSRPDIAADSSHRRQGLEGHPHHQVPPGRRILPTRPGSRIMCLCQHLRALPQLPHRHRLPRRPRRPARRHTHTGRRRRSPRLGQ